MKIWNEFSSSHSADIAVIGRFTSVRDAQKAYKTIEDFALGIWEDRFSTIEEFGSKWESLFPNLKYYFNDYELNLGMDNSPNISFNENQITVSAIRGENISRLVKLMIETGAD